MSILGLTPLGQFPLGCSLLGTSIPSSPPPASRTFTAGKMQGAKAYLTPVELLDYAINWDPLLTSDEDIVTSTWTSTGVIVTAKKPYIQSSGRATAVWLQGVALCAAYLVTNTIVTSDGREFQESFIVNVVAYNLL